MKLDFYDLISSKKLAGVPIVMKSWDGKWLGAKDTTSYWMPQSEHRFIARTLHKILLKGVAKPISEFRSLYELLSAIEDILISASLNGTLYFY